MINANWIRWVRASCRIHFNNAKQGYVLHIEGTDREHLTNLDVFAEFRIDGPHVTPQQGGYLLDVTINIAVQAKQDNADLDKLPRIAGVFQAAYDSVIPIYKYGNGADDDRTSLVGCLVLQDRIRFNNFGVVDEDIKLEQATIEARYQVTLSS